MVGAGHFMIVSHAAAISQILQKLAEKAGCIENGC
jgi:hypothetical protein